MMATSLFTPLAILPDGFALLLAAGAIAFAGLIAFWLLRLSQPRHDQPGAQRRKSRLPSVTASQRRGGSTSEWRPSENGRANASATLRFKSGEGDEYTLGKEAIVIGSASECTIVLAGDGIAPEHARIWRREGKFLLHHVGGLSRKTYVSGQEADWVVLESGDEVAIGAHRFVFDSNGASSEAATAGDVAIEEAPVFVDDLTRMENAVRELWAEALPASETAVGERSGTGKYKVHRRKDELASRVGGKWVKRGRTVVLER
jgi:pSer/pThr/pTyr-binding forkhead associated (FHA) protein